ncbi:MAG: hypothetical protein J7K94_04270 [Dehalococcoidia bacterium]|nr:hypothetical protein [Dehalococcoidia bacterium]
MNPLLKGYAGWHREDEEHESLLSPDDLRGRCPDGHSFLTSQHYAALPLECGAGGLLPLIYFAGITPLLLSASAVYPRAASSSAYSILFIMTSVGGLIVPYVMGHAFELVGAVTAMSLIGVLFLGALASLFLFTRELPIAKHAHYDAFPD